MDCTGEMKRGIRILWKIGAAKVVSTFYVPSKKEYLQLNVIKLRKSAYGNMR